MRVFLYEYVSAVGVPDGPGAESFRAEGAAMLEAVSADFAALPGVEVVTLLAEPNDRVRGAAQLIQPVEESAAFREAAASADHTLVIAPEFEGLLEERCRWVEEVGGRLLGPSSAAVRLTSDKLELSRLWRERGVPTPGCRPLESVPSAPDVPPPWVVKPRHGAGSSAVFLVEEPSALPRVVALARAESGNADLLLQPYVPGLAASVGCLVGPERVVPLLAGEQWLSADGRFRYRGGRLPLPTALAERAMGLAHRALTTVPELRGYVGVDLVLGGPADGTGDRAIEVNPRLTTSYVGLRVLARGNLAGAILDQATGRAERLLTWYSGRVEFTSHGVVRRPTGQGQP